MTSEGAPPPAVVLDANVLIPGALRDTLLRADEAGWYDAYWSDETLAEVERTLARLLAGRAPDAAARARRLVDTLRAAFPAATVTEYRRLLPELTNHPGDRHILAAREREYASYSTGKFSQFIIEHSSLSKGEAHGRTRRTRRARSQ